MNYHEDHDRKALDAIAKDMVLHDGANRDAALGLPDTRQPWTHLGHTITPQGASPTTQPIRFRSRYQTRWWRIDFTDGTWINVGTKTDAIRYIESLDSRNTPGMDWKAVKRYLRTIAGI